MEARILQITSGRGPAECCWVVAQLLKYLIKEAKKNGFKAEVLTREPGELNGTLLSASMKIAGNNLDVFTPEWEGSVLWIGQSQFRKFHKRKNWFVGISFTNENSTANFQLKDVAFQAVRSGGPGGQHVNKVSTAVRAIHKPTGIQVIASDTRSQHQNKELATARLMNLLEKENIEKLKNEQLNQWNKHNTLDRGSPVKTFRGTDFKLIK